MKIRVIVTIMLAINSFSVLAELDVQEGKWEITTQMKMQGPIKVEIPPVTVNQCFTKENMTPDRVLNNKHCEMLKMDITENKVSWKMTCKQAGMQMDGIGDLAYKKTTFDGNFKMMMSGSKEGAMNIDTKLNGHYVGPCK